MDLACTVAPAGAGVSPYLVINTLVARPTPRRRGGEPTIGIPVGSIGMRSLQARGQTRPLGRAPRVLLRRESFAVAASEGRDVSSAAARFGERYTRRESRLANLDSRSSCGLGEPRDE